jgi:hypothetical protein
MRIRRQPAHTPGLVGHALDTDLIEKTFWTVSAWTNNTELNRFDQTDPHRSIKCTIRSAMLPTTLRISGPAAPKSCRSDRTRSVVASVRPRHELPG